MRYTVKELMAYTSAVGQALGMHSAEAKVFAESLIFAEMRGMSSHGLLRLPIYAARIQKGLVAVNASPLIQTDSGSFLSVDGQNGSGAWIAQQTMKLCIDCARQTGICVAAVCNCNHFGCSAYFTQSAAHAHMIGIAMSNAYRSMAPYGGSAAMLGTNPISISIPIKGHEPFLLDMATSTVAQGKVILANKEKRPIPLGWGLDRSGTPTTDPNAVMCGGTLLPFGGVKGYGIALMIELLCVCLAQGAKSGEMGSLYDLSRTQGTGFIIGAADISHIMDLAIFEQAAASLVSEIKSTPKAPGVSEIFIPGEPENIRYQDSLIHGVELSDAVACELHDLGKIHGISFP